MSPRQPSTTTPTEHDCRTDRHHRHHHQRSEDDEDVERRTIQDALLPLPVTPQRTEVSIQPSVVSQKLHPHIPEQMATSSTTVVSSSQSTAPASLEKSFCVSSDSSVIATVAATAAAQEHQQAQSAAVSTRRTKTGRTVVAKTEKKTIKDYIPHYLKRYIQPAPSSSHTDDDGDENNVDDDDNNNVDDTDFCMSTCVTSTKLIAYCMMEGFLPMAYNNYILLPKLHTIRSIIPLRKNNIIIPIPVIPRNMSNTSTSSTSNRLPYDLHISKNTRKRSKHYYMTMNTAFETVIQHCQQQHGGVGLQQQGSCWLYPSLLNLFRAIHMATIQHREGYILTCSKNNKPYQISIRLHSIEVWNTETNEFAAGEIGYTVGNTIYTSLTGCCVEDSAGSVQMAALGALLIYLQSFYIWDLGMDMPYKQTLGAQLIPRQEFINLVHALRIIPEHDNTTSTTTANTTVSGTTVTTTSPMSSLLSSIQWPIQQLKEKLNCRDIIDAITMQTNNNNAAIARTADTSVSKASLPLNKKQRKELKKQSKTDD